MKNQFEQNFDEFKEIINKIKNENNIDNIRKISIEQINNLEKQYSEMNKDIEDNNKYLNIDNNIDLELRIDKN